MSLVTNLLVNFYHHDHYKLKK